MGLAERALSDVYYVALLRFIGCTADAHEVAAFAGDEIELARVVGPHVMGEPADEAAAMGLPGTDPTLARAKAASMAAHCEAAEMLATRLGLSPGVVHVAPARFRAVRRHRAPGRAGRPGGAAAGPHRGGGAGRRAVDAARRGRGRPAR